MKDRGDVAAFQSAIRASTQRELNDLHRRSVVGFFLPPYTSVYDFAVAPRIRRRRRLGYLVATLVVVVGLAIGAWIGAGP